MNELKLSLYLHCNSIKYGKLEKQQEVKKEVKEKEKTSRETLGKYFYDLSKLAFAGLFIGWLTPLATNSKDTLSWAVLIGGVMFTIAFALIGNKILK